MRPRGGAGLGSRAEAAVRAPIIGWRAVDRPRRSSRAGVAGPGLPLGGGYGHWVDCHHCRVFCVRNLYFATIVARSRRRPDPHRRFVAKSPDALSLHRHPGRDCDAAQPLSAFQHCSERAFGTLPDEKREAIRCAVFDSTVALGFSFFINAAILALGAAVFHRRGLTSVADISEAYRLLSPALGAGLASTIFAAELLCSGQNSTLTGTLAGQIVMEGFLHLRMRPWLRRLMTRSLAIVPAALVIGLAGERQATGLLIFSQVVLSFQLPFAVVPLIQFTNDRRKMGEFANARWVAVLAWFVAVAIIALNALLLVLVFRGSSLTQIHENLKS